ncbi:MAG: VOC family protein [Steroidobacter sp.]
MTTAIGSIAELTAQLAVEIAVPDLSSILDFYQSIGFAVERRTDKFAVLRWDTAYLFVAEDKNATTMPRWTNLRIIVPEVDEAWKLVTNLELPVVNSIGDRKYGLRDFIIKDPAGFEIRFASILNDNND